VDVERRALVQVQALAELVVVHIRLCRACKCMCAVPAAAAVSRKRRPRRQYAAPSGKQAAGRRYVQQAGEGRRRRRSTALGGRARRRRRRACIRQVAEVSVGHGGLWPRERHGCSLRRRGRRSTGWGACQAANDKGQGDGLEGGGSCGREPGSSLKMHAVYGCGALLSDASCSPAGCAAREGAAKPSARLRTYPVACSPCACTIPSRDQATHRTGRPAGQKLAPVPPRAACVRGGTCSAQPEEHLPPRRISRLRQPPPPASVGPQQL
jgi:hypothetical protein